MSISINPNKSTIFLIIILGSAGVGSYSVYSNVELVEHITDESPHIGTKITIEHLEKYIAEDKEDMRILNEKIDKILFHLEKLNMMICQYNGYDCN